MSGHVEWYDDPRAFLDRASDLLAAEPVLTSVVGVATRRMALALEAGEGLPDDRPIWWVTEVDGTGLVTGVAMRTAPFPPYPAFVVNLSEAAAVEVARTVHTRGEAFLAMNGTQTSVRALAAEAAALVGGRARVWEETRLHVLDGLVAPPAVPGRLRRMREDEAGLGERWIRGFNADSDAQAGRAEAPMEVMSPDDVLARIRDGVWWIWEDESGMPVHLTGRSEPMAGTVRIGPVYTPEEHRGKGFAAATVAELSATATADGHTVCLFTDLANPVSNRLYARLGYRGVADMVNMEITS